MRRTSDRGASSMLSFCVLLSLLLSSPDFGQGLRFVNETYNKAGGRFTLFL